MNKIRTRIEQHNNMTNEELWQAVLAQIQLAITQAQFATWFTKTSIFSRTEKGVIVSIPNSFSKEWIQNKYHKQILKILNSLDNSIKDIEYQVNPIQQPKPKEEDNYLIPTSTAPLFDQINADKETNLNPKYKFENFVVGAFNELTFAAAQAICKNPGTVYNPFFIYGGTGLGKTHLLQAIGNQVTKDFPLKKIKYIPSETLTSDIINSIHNQTIEELKANYKKVDVLIVDDIQFLSGKEKTQEEFFNVFNALYEKNKQIILSSDRPPKAIAALEDRLRSRFEGGMIADIAIPDFETRIAILMEKANEKGVDLPKDVYEYIATNIQRNVRELEGALNKIIANYKLTGQQIDLEGAKKILKTIISPTLKQKNPERIVQVVAEFYNLKEKDIYSESRKKEIVRPRQIAMYLLRLELKKSFPEISRFLGGKDHTTAIYACKKVESAIKDVDGFSDEIDTIKQMIYSC